MGFSSIPAVAAAQVVLSLCHPVQSAADDLRGSKEVSAQAGHQKTDPDEKNLYLSILTVTYPFPPQNHPNFVAQVLA